MEKFLRPKDKILLGLNLLMDFSNEFFEPISTTMAKIYHSLPPDYKPPSFYAAFYRTLATGEIKKLIKDEKPYYQLTSLGKKRLQRKFPLLKLQKKKWDGWWRIVIFDINEKNKKTRDLLRDKLKTLGFGMWQRSVYITPFNVAEDMRQFFITHGLKDQACVLVAKDLFAGNIKELVAKIWDLETLNKQYSDLMDSWEWEKSPAAKLSFNQLKKKARKNYSKYLEIISQDPFLPYNI